MKRIIVIGCPGAGKTTFSERLHERIGLPLYHLDAIWHKPDRTHISREEFDERLGQILDREMWIIDGNYSRTVARRIEACDTVILFDLPTQVCLDGAIARLGQKRPDMPWIDTELDPWLKNEIETFGEENLPRIYALLEAHREGKQIIVLKSHSEADGLLRQLTQTTNE